jgi:hypothetical protein
VPAIPSKYFPTRVPCRFSCQRNGFDLSLSYPNSSADLILPGQKSGWSLPGYRHLMKVGANASTPYSCDFFAVTSAKPFSFSFSAKYKVGYKPNLYNQPDKFLVKGYPTQQGNFLHYASLTSEQSNRALVKLLKQIKEQTVQFSGLTFLGELRETIHMIRHPAEALRKNTEKYLKTIKNTRQKVASRSKQRRGESAERFAQRRANAVKDALSGSWLEYKFGVLPLLSDIKEIADAYIAAVSNEERLTTARGNSPNLVVVENPSSDVREEAEGIRLGRVSSSSSTVSVSLRAGLRFKASVPTSPAGRLVELSGLTTFQDFVPTVWELVPWSFLADYFVNIGEVLEGAFTDTSNVFWATRTVRQVTVRTTTFGASLRNRLDDPNTAGYYIPVSIEGQTLCTRSVKRISVVRTDILGNLGIPQLEFSIPGSDSTKWVNMAALALQSYKRGKSLFP